MIESAALASNQRNEDIEDAAAFVDICREFFSDGQDLHPSHSQLPHFRPQTSCNLEWLLRNYEAEILLLRIWSGKSSALRLIRSSAPSEYRIS